MARPSAEPVQTPSPRSGAGRGATVPCAHCGSPSPVPAPGDFGYCCNGCRVAHASVAMLACPVSSQPLPDTNERPPAASPTAQVLDTPEFLSQHARVDPAGIAQIELAIRGMHCAACVWRIEALPEQLPGVIESRVQFRRGRLSLVFDSTRISLGKIAQRLELMGYPVGPVSQAASVQRRDVERTSMIRMAVAGACAGNAMVLAFALYAGLFDGMAPVYREGFRWGSLAVTGISLLWPGMVFFRSAWAAIRTGSINLDGPIALALLAGGLWSTVSTITGHGEVYFDSVSVLIFALLVGRYVQQRQQRWAADSVELLFSLTPQSARRVKADGSVEVIPTQSLERGDLVEVLAGDSFPCDGQIVSGHTSVDTSLLTGESLPRSCEAGDEVFAGAVNVASTVRCLTTASGADTRVAKLMALVEDNSSRKAPIVQFADKVGSIFLTGMLLLAAATFIFWFSSGMLPAMENAVALLVVTCPCALGLATPLAFTLAIGRAARQGILIKGGDAVQHMAGSSGILFLDKTGTITDGKMSVVHWSGSQKLANTVAAIERGSTHPVGVALAAMARHIPGSIDDAIESVTNVPGSGIRAQVGFTEILVGSENFARAHATTLPSDLIASASTWSAQGLTPVFVVVDGCLQAVAAVGDTIRKDSCTVIGELRRFGWDCRILSGDNPGVVRHVAALCGISDARGGVTPEEKLAIVATAAAQGRTVMVGDGVNDAAALAAAHVGVSVHGGAEASLAAADIYLAKPGLSSMLTLIRGSRHTLRTIKITLAASSLYNIAAATVAMTGHMHPIIAALIMPLSSLTAVGICVAAGSFKEKQS
jgi:Cu2+-exporting ATPase